MKAFLVLLVLSAAGLAGVLYWRHTLHAPKPPVAGPAEPTKKVKERRHRRKRSARRLARNEVARNDTFIAAAPSGDAPAGDEPPRRGGTRSEASRTEEYKGEAPARVFDQPDERPSPVRGGASMTETGPADIFGSAPAPSAPGSRRQVVEEPEPEPIKLRPADLKIVWQGEDLSKTETMRLDMSKDAIGHELSQDEIDTRFRGKEDAVLRCIEKARPDQYTEIPGRVTVRFRIQKTGPVKGVQVEAPVVLHRGGLTNCIKGVVGSLKFPASDSSQVISYPFTLM